MNKFTKYAGATIALVGLGCLLYPKQAKSEVKFIKKYLTTSIQLTNRLIEQLKTSKQAVRNFTQALKGLNINQFTQQADQSVNQLQSRVDDLQKVIKQTKNN